MTNPFDDFINGPDLDLDSIMGGNIPPTDEEPQLSPDIIQAISTIEEILKSTIAQWDVPAGKYDDMMHELGNKFFIIVAAAMLNQYEGRMKVSDLLYVKNASMFQCSAQVEKLKDFEVPLANEGEGTGQYILDEKQIRMIIAYAIIDTLRTFPVYLDMLNQAKGE